MNGRRPDVLGDEFGDPADNPQQGKDGVYNPTRFFGYGISMPSNPETFGTIRIQLGELPEVKKKWGRRNNKEIKTRKLSKKNQLWLAKKLSRDSDSFALVVNKEGELPIGWSDYTSAERMIALAMYAIRQAVMLEDKTDLTIIFDQHSVFDSDWAKSFIDDYLSNLELETKKTIHFDTGKSSSGPYSNELQVVDAISHFTFLERENKQRHLRKKAHIKVYALGAEDNIIIDNLRGYSERYRLQSKNKSCRGPVYPPKHGIFVIAEVL